MGRQDQGELSTQADESGNLNGGVFPHTHPTDDLLRRSRDGDTLASDDLCRRLGPKVEWRVRGHNLASSLSRYHELDDVLQEVWVRFLAAQGWTRFEQRGPGSLQRYINGFVDKVMHDLLRRATTQKKGGGEPQISIGFGGHTDDLTVDPPDPGPTPTSGARLDEIHTLAAEVLDGTELQVYLLRIPPESRKSAEVSELLQMPASTVRNVWGRAMRKMEARIGGSGAPTP